MKSIQFKLIAGGFIVAILTLILIGVALAAAIKDPSRADSLWREYDPFVIAEPSATVRLEKIKLLSPAPTDTPIPTPSPVTATPSPACLDCATAAATDSTRLNHGALATLSTESVQPSAHPTYQPTDLPCQSCHQVVQGTP